MLLIIDAMGRIWLDTSALLFHSGNPTGCIRVEMEVLARLEDFGDWGIFYLNIQTGVFTEIGSGSTKDSALEVFNSFKANTDIDRPSASKFSRIYQALFGSIVPWVPIKEDDVVLSVGIHNQDNFVPLAKAYTEMNKAKLAIYVHDIIGVLFPSFFQPKNATFERYEKYFSDICFFSDLVFTNSQTTRNDLIRYFSLENPIIVKLGDNFSPKSINVVDENRLFESSNPFVTYVSTIEPRKNHQVLVNAYLLAKSIGKLQNLPDLYFIGRKGWGTHSWMDTIENDSLLRQKIKIIDSVGDEELDYFYENSLAVLYPSFYEGWGLPVREALIRGKYCLVSTGGALSEHVNPLVKHISPWNAEEWMFSIEELSLLQQNDILEESFKPREWSDFTNEIFCTIKVNLTRENSRYGESND